MKISNINSLLPYHSHINTNTTIEVINYIIDEVNKRNTIFYDIYSNGEEEEFVTLLNQLYIIKMKNRGDDNLLSILNY